MANKKIDITDEMIKRAEEAASKGLNKEQVAYRIGIGKTKLYEEIKDNTELADAIKRGNMKAIEDVTNALYETAMSGNTTAQIFFLKNKAGWRDRQEIDNTSSDGSMTPKETQIVFTPVGKDD